MTATSGQFVKIASMVDGSLRLTIDVPKERAQEALAVLGFPAGQTVALARLNESADAHPSSIERRCWPVGDPSAEAGAAPIKRNALEPADIKESRPAPSRKAWHELTRAQQAGIRCGEERFADFLRNRYLMRLRRADHDPAEFVRRLCAVSSRSELNKGGTPADVWDALDAEYRRWAGLETEPRG